MEDGVVVGATTVEVFLDGPDNAATNYNVEFLDGVCTDLFAPCSTQGGGFDFNEEAAKDATQKLLALFNGSAFTNNPSAVSGCPDENTCLIMTPFKAGETNFFASSVRLNKAFENQSPIEIKGRTFDTRPRDSNGAGGDEVPGQAGFAFAKWNSAVPVPEVSATGALAAFGSLFAIMALLRERRRTSVG